MNGPSGKFEMKMGHGPLAWHGFANTDMTIHKSRSRHSNSLTVTCLKPILSDKVNMLPDG